MARRYDGRVEPGQSLKTAFSAKAWNRAQDAADVVLKTLGGVQGQEVPRQALPYTWVLARNTTGEPIAVGGNLGLSTSTVEVVPTSVDEDNATIQFQRMPVMTAVKYPAGFVDDKTLAIAVEPIKNNEIGRVAISGVVPAKMKVNELDDRYAIGTNDVEQMETSRYGPARILYVAGNKGFQKQWGLLQLDVQGRTALISFSDNWGIDTEKTVDVVDSDLTLKVKNVFAPIFNSCGELRYGTAQLQNKEWYLTAVEFGNPGSFSDSTGTESS